MAASMEEVRSLMVSLWSNATYWEYVGAYGISEFADAADGWVAAYARVHGAIVVTHERRDPNVKKRVPLGNVCHEFDLPVKDTFEMLRELHVRFGWERL